MWPSGCDPLADPDAQGGDAAGWSGLADPTSLTYIRGVFTFVETRLFTRLVGEYLSDDEYRRFQEALAELPDSGDVIPGSGGVRKLRWGVGARGKRGGLRVIYYVRLRGNVIWLLTLYSKNVADDIPAHVLRRIRKEIEND